MLATLCGLPELVHCPEHVQCGDTAVAIAVPLSREHSLGEGPKLETALRADLAAAEGEAPAAFLVTDFMVTSWGDNILLRATVHVDLQPCERAQAVAENLKQQVSEQTLAFPSIAAAEAAPQTPLGTKRRVTGVLVLNGELPADAEATVAAKIAETLGGGERPPFLAASDVKVTITSEPTSETALLQTRAARHSVHFEVMKAVSDGYAQDMESRLKLAVAKGPSGPLQLPGLDPEASSIGATPEAAELPAVPPAPLAQKPPEKAEVEVDLTESAMVPAAAAGMLLWLIPAFVYP